MIGQNIVHRLNRYKSVSSTNLDTKVSVGITQTNKLLPPGDMDRILNVGEQFQKEREASTRYRFVITLRSLISNVLTDIGDAVTPSTLKFFGNDLFLKDDNNEEIYDTEPKIDSSMDDNMKELNGWFGYYLTKNSSTNQCKFYELLPNKEIFDISPKTITKNWDIFLSYPESIDDQHYVIRNGLLIVSTGIGIVGGKELKSCTTPVKHGLSLGNMVDIDGSKFKVLRLGNDDGSNQEHTFVVDIETSSNIFDSSSRVRRLNGSTLSTYYFRKFKKLTNTGEYNVFPISFSKNIYGDKVNQIVFNKDIDTSVLTDNKGRPISEVFLTIIKKNNNGFTKIDSGIDIPFIGEVGSFDNVCDIHRIHNVSSWGTKSQNTIESNVSATSEYFYGDIVEYNAIDVEEKVLSDINHRFNRVNRDNNGRPEGYYYKPHHRIKIRDWSTFVEQGDENTYNLPDYAENLSNGVFLWRDLLSIGFSDGQETTLDYPFLNGSHYLHSNISLNVKRQDPFNQYTLYYGTSPRDVFGKSIDYDIIKKVGDTDECCK